jgi:hypothetical protein
MTLNHLNLTVDDVQAAQEFRRPGVGVRSCGATGPDAVLVWACELAVAAPVRLAPRLAAVEPACGYR